MTKRIFSVGHIHPHRDWMRTIIIFSLLALVVVGWSFYLLTVSQTDINTEIAPQVESGNIKSSSSIDKVTGFFDSREKSLASSTIEHFVDPSI
ncbi:MAG: hypothetical protein WC629_00025 [Candidatus Paceibacterota bacterium]